MSALETLLAGAIVLVILFLVASIFGIALFLYFHWGDDDRLHRG